MKMFDFAEITNDMSEIEILNYYRNLYYTEPQVTEHGIVANAINDMFDFINRQKAEIERLNKQMERLKGYNENLMSGNTALSEEILLAKAEAYKEFAERLKEKCYEDFQETYEMLSPYVTDDDIDDLLKEMVGEEE